MSRPKKKIVLFLVEGATDKEVLAEPFAQLFERNDKENESTIVEFSIFNQDKKYGGDITASFGVSPENIEGIISKTFVDTFLEENPYYYPKEISEIIHIVDLDGTFVDDNYVIEDMSVQKTEYFDDRIVTSDRTAIIDRNKRKSDNIRKLVSMKSITIRPKNHRNTKEIKYSVYFFSCNMDHYIHEQNNLSPREKVELADKFSAKCSFDLEAFCKRICDSAVAFNDMTYEESWEEVMQGKNSLNRHTNLNLLVDRLRSNNE